MKKLENLGIIGLLRHNVGNPLRGVDQCQGVGYPRRGEAEVPKWHPQVMLRRGVATVHIEQFFGFFFPSTSYSYIDSLRTLVNY